MSRHTMSTAIAVAAVALGLGAGAAQAAPTVTDSGASASGAAATSGTNVADGTESEAARPLLRVPFNCGRTWRTATGSHHRDSDGYHSIDMNWGSGSDDYGSPVLASGSGTATVYLHSGGYGKHVVVRHSGGWSTLYAHLSEVNVRSGQSVGPRTVLGKLGASGSVTAPHLHYAQKLNGVVKPIKFGTSTFISYPNDSVTRVRDCR